MTEVTMEDRFFVLEQKLKEAESAIFGCRAMLNYCQRLEAEAMDRGDERCVQRTTRPNDDGLYPGQLREGQDQYLKEPECIE